VREQFSPLAQLLPRLTKRPCALVQEKALPHRGAGRQPATREFMPAIGGANYIPVCSKINDSLLRPKSISSSVRVLALVVPVTTSACTA